MTIEEFKKKHGISDDFEQSTAVLIAAKKAKDRTRKGTDYCAIGCGGGPFKISEMHLITPEEDPYVQCDGMKIRMCDKCWQEKLGEEKQNTKPVFTNCNVCGNPLRGRDELAIGACADCMNETLDPE